MLCAVNCTLTLIAPTDACVVVMPTTLTIPVPCMTATDISISVSCTYARAKPPGTRSGRSAPHSSPTADMTLIHVNSSKEQECWSKLRNVIMAPRRNKACVTHVVVSSIRNLEADDVDNGANAASKQAYADKVCGSQHALSSCAPVRLPH